MRSAAFRGSSTAYARRTRHYLQKFYLVYLLARENRVSGSRFRAGLMGGLGARVCVQGEMAANVMLVTSMVLLMLTQPVFGHPGHSDDIEFVTIQDTNDYQECIADPPTCVELCAPFSTSGILSGISVVILSGGRRGLLGYLESTTEQERNIQTAHTALLSAPTPHSAGFDGLAD